MTVDRSVGQPERSWRRSRGPRCRRRRPSSRRWLTSARTVGVVLNLNRVVLVVVQMLVSHCRHAGQRERLQRVVRLQGEVAETETRGRRSRGRLVEWGEYRRVGTRRRGQRRSAQVLLKLGLSLNSYVRGRRGTRRRSQDRRRYVARVSVLVDAGDYLRKWGRWRRRVGRWTGWWRRRRWRWRRRRSSDHGFRFCGRAGEGYCRGWVLCLRFGLRAP